MIIDIEIHYRSTIGGKIKHTISYELDYSSVIADILLLDLYVHDL